MKRIKLHMKNTGKPVCVDADCIVVAEELTQTGTALVVNTGAGYSIQVSESFADVLSALGVASPAPAPKRVVAKEK